MPLFRAAVPLVLCFIIAMPAAARFAPMPPSGEQRPPRLFGGDSSLPGPSTGRELRDVRRRVDRARDGGIISRRQARQLHREVRTVSRLERRYGRDGLSSAERAELQTRTQLLREAIGRPVLLGSRSKR